MIYELKDSRLTMVEQFTKWTTLTGPACLCSVHSIKSLVEEQANGPGQVDPGRAIGIKSRIVPQHGQDIDNHKTKSSEGNLVGQVSAK